MTNKAKKEIEVLTQKRDAVKAEIAALSIKEESSQDYQVNKLLRAERNKLYNKEFNYDRKLETVAKHGYSTAEESAVKKELPCFHQFSYDRSLGMTNLTKVGMSKVLNSHVKVSYVRYSGFMSNVKGCGSLANTTSIDTIEFLTPEQYQELLNQERASSTSFCGTENRVLPSIASTLK